MKKKKYKKFYEQIWDTRKIMDMDGAYYANCEECGKRIYEQDVTVYNFSHRKSKGSSPELALDPTNIDFWCTIHHVKHEMGGNPTNHLPMK